MWHIDWALRAATQRDYSAKSHINSSRLVVARRSSTLGVRLAEEIVQVPFVKCVITLRDAQNNYSVLCAGATWLTRMLNSAESIHREDHLSGQKEVRRTSHQLV
jgi:hypothetical protein